jgi:hypothetical protein
VTTCSTDHEPAGPGILTRYQAGRGELAHRPQDRFRYRAKYAEGHRIDIISGPASGATGLPVGRAAAEVIRAVMQARGKKVTGSRNGWYFWILTATGKALQPIRP